MEPPARHYLCARCRTSVLICSHCDRGQRYCAGACTKQARIQSLQESGQRYQTSRHGRLNHAARQRRYRARQIKVTHHGSPLIPVTDLLPANPTLPTQPCHLPWHCHFCGQLQSQFIRHRFLQRRIRRPLRLSDRRESHHDPTR